ncbi:outer dense fiber protein 2-like [Salvelinus namaycush]|uniref:Outer dense fiber protein 2-like n=1 Tax=Salvelinus namaycush TaxID=8040 RepID=A0A8U0P7I8_SALNM|nr:outer dense fiber protein 2-like [Salvelinus namaycush]XP_038819703.1 outer dense fiber protein 2-like [Salvelinus namaycush]
MSSEDPFQDSLDDDLDGFSEPGRGSRIRSSVYTKTPEMESNCYGDYGATGGKSPLMKTLMDAEAAANSAAVQLMSFKETLEDDFADSRHSASDNRRMSRQRGLLLEKLEVFKRINKSVRQQLKDLQDAEASRMETDKHIDLLLKKLTQAECDNLHLKRNLNDKEKMVDELMGLRKKEMENTENAVHATKSVETTRAHLQGQLHSKEADNNRLTVQLRGLERQLTEQKLEIDGLRGEISSVSEKAEQEKEGLKKATRAQKQRAERFEAAVDKCYTQLREKDVQLAEACSERDTWRRQQEQKTNARILLDAQIGLLKGQIADITAKLQKEREEFTAANEVLLLKVEKLNAENGDIGLENATLKASIVELELQLVHSKAALKEESTVSQERKDQAEQYQSQVAELQMEVEDLRIKLEGFLREAENIREGRDAEVKKVERQGEKMRSSVDMKESIHEANSQLRQKLDALQKQMEELHGENQELIRRLAGQEEALHYSSRQLEQRSADCQALNRQLEAAVADVRQQVSKVKDKAVSRESSLQTRILELEAEKSRRENELKHMKQSKQSAEKQFEVRLKDLQLSLDQSKSHKQSIQNYVDFLKNSYTTMFDEGLPQTPSSFESSYFFK